MRILNESYPSYKKFSISDVSKKDLIDLMEFIASTTQKKIKLIESGNYEKTLFPKTKIKEEIHNYILTIGNSNDALLFKMKYSDIIENPPMKSMKSMKSDYKYDYPDYWESDVVDDDDSFYTTPKIWKVKQTK